MERGEYVISKYIVFFFLETSTKWIDSCNTPTMITIPLNYSKSSQELAFSYEETRETKRWMFASERSWQCTMLVPHSSSKSSSCSLYQYYHYHHHLHPHFPSSPRSPVCTPPKYTWKLLGTRRTHCLPMFITMSPQRSFKHLIKPAGLPGAVWVRELAEHTEAGLRVRLRDGEMDPTKKAGAGIPSAMRQRRKKWTVSWTLYQWMKPLWKASCQNSQDADLELK